MALVAKITTLVILGSIMGLVYVEIRTKRNKFQFLQNMQARLDRDGVQWLVDRARAATGVVEANNSHGHAFAVDDGSFFVIKEMGVVAGIRFVAVEMGYAGTTEFRWYGPAVPARKG